MSVWNDQKIGEWTPTQLAKFVQETIASDPPPLPPQITLDSLSVIGDTEIGGQVTIQGITNLLGKTTIAPPAALLAGNGADQSVSSSTETTVQMNTRLYLTSDMGFSFSTNAIKIRSKGLYLLGAACHWEANGTGNRRLWIEDKDSGYVYLRDNRKAAGGSNDSANFVVGLNYFSHENIWLRCRVEQNSGSTLALRHNTYSPYLWAIKLSK